MRVLFLCGLLLSMALIHQTPVTAAELTGEQVENSIARGKKFLDKLQHPDGSWDEFSLNPYAVPSLITLALLNSGVPPDDPKMVSALNYLRLKQPETIYSAALQTMVFCAATPKKDRSLITRNANLLVSWQITDGKSAGSWSYMGKGRTRFAPEGDNSNAQFALLALHEAELVGVKIDPQTWQLARKYWEESQNPDGSWGYHPGEGGTGSMTCAGITSMIIALGHTGKGDAEINGDQVLCCGQQQKNNSVERGLEWLGRNFTVTGNPSGGGNRDPSGRNTIWHLYYLYGLERTGRMSARRFIGTHDWYREGAELLIDRQDHLGGYWHTSESDNEYPEICTSLALLFLSKGRRPVVAAKLKFGPTEDWNHHRSDLANLTSYTEAKWNKPLTYQVFDISRTSIDDLLQAPVLYFDGSTKPEFTKSQIKLLREYVDRGGFIFAEATCRECTEFHEGMQKLIQQIFPEPEYGLRLLPPEHPIWHAEERVDPKLHRPLYGVEFGCRTCLVYSPPPRAEDPSGNLSCYWELGYLDRDPNRQISPKVRAEINAAFSIGINVLSYATNRDPPKKDEVPRTVVENSKPDNAERGKLYVANVRHPGGCDVAPAALPNLLRLAENQLHMRVGVEERQVALTEERLANYPLLFFHGRNGFHLSKEERDALRKYVIEQDGTILADAICANKTFSASFRAEMQSIFPQVPLSPVPATDSLLTDKHGGYDLSHVKRREPQAGGSDDPLKVKMREGPAELEAIKIGDRYAIIFSPYDLSCALEKHQSLECEGYSREDAERIALNVILYFLQEGSAKKKP